MSSENLKKIFSERLKSLIEIKGVKVNKLCEILNIKRASMFSYLRGATLPEIKNLKKICDYFEVTSDYMLGYVDNTCSKVHEAYFCNSIGLSSEAFYNIKDQKKYNKDNENYFSPIDTLLSDKEFVDTFSQLFVAYYKLINGEDISHMLPEGISQNDAKGCLEYCFTCSMRDFLNKFEKEYKMND